MNSKEKIDFPPLPEPGHRGPDGTGDYFDAFTAWQMRDYVAADRAQRQAQEPVGTLHISHFRGLENTQFEKVIDLPDGEYPLYTTPQPAPVQPLTEAAVSGCLNRAQASENPWRALAYVVERQCALAWGVKIAGSPEVN